MRLLVLAAAVAALAACGAPPSAVTDASDTVASVTDGDTLRLTNGDRVRLVQIDTPELGRGECYAHEARSALSRLLPPGTRVRLESDPRLDALDSYGRRLAYVFKGRENVNVTLVTRGAASAYFYRGERGRYAAQLDRAARAARSARRGLWGACPATTYAPDAGVDTGRGS